MENKSFKFIDYSQFWDITLQKVEEIQRKLDIHVLDLEKEYSRFEDHYNLIEEEVDTLSAIYSSLNTMSGREYLLKLRSLVKKYKKRYTLEGIDFVLINFLITKITDQRNKSFEDFPVLDHDIKAVLEKNTTNKSKNPVQYMKKPYKWITFERNNSWFIASYKKIVIARENNAEIISFNQPDTYLIKSENKIIKAKDIFLRPEFSEKKPRYFIVINDGAQAFAANRIGKMIFSKSDFISLKVKPFDKTGINRLSPGRCRIFGKNHILLHGSFTTSKA